MVYRQVILWILAIIVWTSALSACSPAAEQPSPDTLERSVSLTSAQKSKALAAEDIESFMVTLNYSGQTDTEVNVGLETIQGASWRAALCYDDFCYFHNGKDKLVHTLPLAASEKKRLEIKMFVPENVSSGEAKKLMVDVSSVENRGILASVELEGFVP